MSSSTLPSYPIPLLTTIASFREWRRKAFEERKSVGFVATMGALHDGHLSLVKRSLSENDLTALSIFVNPAQFAPHEDLTTYPRTLSRDVELLVAQSMPVPSAPSLLRTPSVIFLPSVQEMYPSGISQDSSSQNGTFVEVQGYGHQMEGKSRPTFFRGVATVVTKLFNVIEPTNTYFGQKDIQQALLLRRLCKDLLLSHPDPNHLHIVPTARDPFDGLALSSRNAYLTADERRLAGALYAALKEAERLWNDGATKEESVARAINVIEGKKEEAVSHRVDMRMDYLEMNDSVSFEVLGAGFRKDDAGADPVILSGALWFGKTRLIDNIILGEVDKVLG